MHDKYIYSIIKIGKQKKSETTIYIENYMVIFEKYVQLRNVSANFACTILQRCQDDDNKN